MYIHACMHIYICRYASARLLPEQQVQLCQEVGGAHGCAGSQCRGHLLPRGHWPFRNSQLQVDGCMYIFIYANPICRCIQGCVYMYNANMCVYLYVYRDINMHANIFVVCLCICLFVCMYTFCEHTHTHIYRYIHIYMYISTERA